MIYGKQSSDAPEAVAFEVEFERLLTNLVVVAERKWLRRVGAATSLALAALRAGAVESRFHLMFCVLAIGTSKHV